jgi:hypothetical protein
LVDFESAQFFTTGGSKANFFGFFSFEFLLVFLSPFIVFWDFLESGKVFYSIFGVLFSSSFFPEFCPLCVPFLLLFFNLLFVYFSCFPKKRPFFVFLFKRFLAGLGSLRGVFGGFPVSSSISC